MEENDLKSASASMQEEQTPYTKARPGMPKKPVSKKPMLIIIGLVLLIVAGLGGYKMYARMQANTKTPAVDPNVISEEAEKPKIRNDIANTPLTETYKSTALSLGFKYPKTWKVTETDGGLRVESPTFNYMPAQAASLDGNFRIYMRQGARKVDGTYIGRGIAIKPSDKLTYTQPATGQRTDTWLSSFGYDSPDIFSFFLIAGNFQLKEGDTLGPDYGKEPDTYIIVGGYSSSAATDDLAMNSVSLDYYATTNAYKQALQILGSLQLF